MKHGFPRLLGILLVILLPLISFAQQNGDHSNTDEIETLMKATDLDHQLQQLPEEMVTQFGSNPFNLAESDNDRLLELYRDSFVQSRLWDEAYNTFASDYNSSSAQATLNWLESTAGKQISRAKHDYHTIQGVRKQVVRKYEMEQEPPSDKRVALIDSLMEVSGITESRADAYTTIFRSFVLAYDIVSDQQSFSDSQIATFSENYRSQLLPELRAEIKNELLVKYYDLTRAQLERMIFFYRSEAGSWLRNTASESLQSTFQAAADRFIASVEQDNP